VKGYRVAAAGRYTALFATLPVEAKVVQGMVPSGIELASQSLTPDGQHPLLLMFGHHTGVHPAWFEVKAWSYHEFLVAIPWLSKPGNPTAWSHLSRLYLDNWPMIVAGWCYAFPKLRGSILTTQGSYDVRTWIVRAPRISAEWQLEGSPGPASAFPHFDGVAPTFAQTFIQRFPPFPYIASRMVFELPSATLQASSARVEISEAFLLGLPTGSFSFDSIAASPLGAFTIEVPWTLSWPTMRLTLG